MSSAVAVSAATLAEHVAAVLEALGTPTDRAAEVAAALVDADRVGMTSHGVRQLPYYVGQIRAGELDVTRAPSVVADHGSLVVLDGGYGFGHVVGREAARIAGERARRHRVGAVAVRRANHLGRLGAYAEALADEGLIALLLATCEGAGQMLAPFGGVERRLANNPIALAVPGPAHPILLDMALSVSAESRVLQAAERGEPVPEGWVLDGDGKPTTDAGAYLAGGTLVPVGGLDGGHKGYGLIVLVELIVGLLSGGPLCSPEERRFSNGCVLLALDPGPDARAADVAAFAAWVKSSRRRAGFEEILLPGEPEARRRAADDRRIALDDVTVRALDELAASLGLDRRLASCV